jgi:hypothetical protein
LAKNIFEPLGLEETYYVEILFTVEEGKAAAVRMEREGDVSKGTRVQ